MSILSELQDEIRNKKQQAATGNTDLMQGFRQLEQEDAAETAGTSGASTTTGTSETSTAGTTGTSETSTAGTTGTTGTGSSGNSGTGTAGTSGTSGKSAAGTSSAAINMPSPKERIKTPFTTTFTTHQQMIEGNTATASDAALKRMAMEDAYATDSIAGSLALDTSKDASAANTDLMHGFRELEQEDAAETSENNAPDTSRKLFMPKAQDTIKYPFIDILNTQQQVAEVNTATGTGSSGNSGTGTAGTSGTSGKSAAGTAAAAINIPSPKERIKTPFTTTFTTHQQMIEENTENMADAYAVQQAKLDMEISDLEDQLKDQYQYEDIYIASGDMEAATAAAEKAMEIQGQIGSLKTEKETNQYNQFYTELGNTKEELEQVVDDPDFEQYALAGKNAGTKNKVETAFATREAINATLPTADDTQDMVLWDIAAVDNDAGTGADEPDSLLYSYMTDYERDVYNYYIGKGDTETANEYLGTLERYLNYRMSQAVYDYEKENASENKAEGVLTNIGASFTTPFAMIGTAGQAIENLVTGEYEPADPYSDWMRGAIVEQATRAGLTEGLDGMEKLLADTGLSIGQYVTKIPFGPTAALVIMSSGAAGSTAQDVLARGGSTKQAVVAGTAAGITEYLTEKLPLDNLIKIAKGGTKAVSKKGIAEIFKQAGMEGTEELVSEYANILTDISVMGKKSEYNQYIQSLISQGMSESEATNRANTKFFIEQPALAAAGGLISGGTMGTGATFVGSSFDAGTGTAGESLESTAAQNRAGEEWIAPYTVQETENLSSAKGFVSGGNTTFNQFINKVKNATGTQRFYFGKVSDALASKIEKAVGQNLSGYNIVIRSDEVRHIYGSHGNEATEAQRGQIAITDEILSRLPEVFNAPDAINNLDTVDYAGRKAFEIQKEINGYAIAVTGISNGRNNIEIDSFRVINKKKPPTTSDAAMQPQTATSKTSNGPASSSQIIPQNYKNVNTGGAGTTADTARVNAGSGTNNPLLRVAQNTQAKGAGTSAATGTAALAGITKAEFSARTSPEYSEVQPVNAIENSTTDIVPRITENVNARSGTNNPLLRAARNTQAIKAAENGGGGHGGTENGSTEYGGDARKSLGRKCRGRYFSCRAGSAGV